VSRLCTQQQMHDTMAGSHKHRSATASTSRSYELSRATTRVARLANGLDQSARRCARPQPCLRRGGLAMPALRGRMEARGAARGGAAAHPLSPAKHSTARRSAFTETHRTDGELGSISGSGAQTRRGIAVLWLDGQHTGRYRSPAARLNTAGPHREASKGEERRRWPRGAHVGSAV
jgi:hypothetical protein